jgi:hypothetical protein
MPAPNGESPSIIMKRNTDVSRLRSAQVQKSGETSARPSNSDAERAAMLIVHSLQESDGPICELSDALARMARTLNDIGAPLFGEVEANTMADVQAIRTVFARDIAICIQSLQFHDRLMQQLTQARDVLTGTSAKLAAMPDMPANEDGIEGSIELF